VKDWFKRSVLDLFHQGQAKGLTRDILIQTMSQIIFEEGYERDRAATMVGLQGQSGGS
jgi:hypothetical protein